jgi:hypothetical protein
VLDLLPFGALKQLEIFLVEPGHKPVHRIGHRHVHQHQVNIYFDGLGVRFKRGIDLSRSRQRGLR